jgi:AcrR family transcriptional regulator
MPAHPKTTDAQIVKAALRLVERHGRDGFSMNDVAGAVGIRAPSLYNRFKDRASLLAAVELQVWAELAGFLESAVIANDPAATLTAQAHAIRRFAKSNPNSYSLFFDIRSEPTEDGTKARAAAVATLMPALAVLVGEQHAFAAARVFVPFLHGFISMELANGFRLGAGVDEAFETGLLTILWGLGRFARA